jgi:hypothetical protein
MKLALASAFLVGSAAAFAPTFATRPSSALKMSTVETPTYTFAKSEEIFAEAQQVSTSITHYTGTSTNAIT